MKAEPSGEREPPITPVLESKSIAAAPLPPPFWHKIIDGDRTTNSNPNDPTEYHDPGSSRSSDGSRLQLAIAIAFVGCFFGAIMSAVEHFLVFMLLETSFAPPLRAQENFGQFGFLTVYIGFFGGVYGLSLGLIPYTGFVGWLPVFLSISFLAGFAEPIDFTTTAGFAMIVIALVVLLNGLVTNLGARWQR